MYKLFMKCMTILAVLLICLISISSAAGPWYLHNELYTAQCGILKEVSANYGILANDPTGTTVIDPELITIDPKYGTIHVAADGSFVYDPSPGISSGSYVRFYYKATNGVSESRNSGLAKIQISCKCRPYTPDISLSAPITREEIIASIEAKADCLGCGDTTPAFDFSAIPAGDVPPGSYPYSVKCKGCNQARGTVIIEADLECSGLPGQCPADGNLCTVEQCKGGKCVSEPVICAGGMCCPDLGCFDYVNSDDPNNCGGCGNICPSGSCLGGKCVD
jgi:hypothetical protein